MYIHVHVRLVSFVHCSVLYVSFFMYYCIIVCITEYAVRHTCTVHVHVHLVSFVHCSVLYMYMSFFPVLFMYNIIQVLHLLLNMQHSIHVHVCICMYMHVYINITMLPIPDNAKIHTCTFTYIVQCMYMSKVCTFWHCPLDISCIYSMYVFTV